MTTTHYIEDRDGDEIEVEVEWSYSPGQPYIAFLTPFGHGQPGEPPEVEIESVTADGKEIEITDAQSDAITRSIEDKIKDGYFDDY